LSWPQNAESQALSDALEELGREAAPAPDRHRHRSVVFVDELSDGSKEYLNRRWYKYAGLSLDHGNGWGWKVVVHPDDLERLFREWLALVDDASSFMVTATKGPHVSLTLPLKSGHKWLLIHMLVQAQFMSDKPLVNGPSRPAFIWNIHGFPDIGLESAV